MKKLSSSILLSILIIGGCAYARTQYDQYGRMIYDDSIRGHQRMEQQKIRAAAAAKINYDEALKNLEEENNTPKNTAYQKLKERYQKQKY